MGSLRNRKMQNSTPTSPQRQCCSRNMNAEDFNIYSTPRKLISSLQYPDDVDLYHSDIQSPVLSREKTKVKIQSPTKAAETISSSSPVKYSEETTPRSQMIMSKKKKKKKKKKSMSYSKLMFAISFFVVVLFTSVMMFNQDDDVGYHTVPT
ncbi:protein SINE1-like [Raphanus sativus]|uniref:Protein SINE1-like n=1 Tax=Raphanus sativus TaxID=3726 RepID=A0A9W3CE68_RAPSA|nr:protein SINE1-like [Raphanus sativus]